MAERMSRDEMQWLPVFESAEAAFMYFREKYGKDFSYQGSTVIDGVECWYCNLILDHEVYERGMRDLRMGTPAVGKEFPLSYQPFELRGGHVHIIH